MMKWLKTRLRRWLALDLEVPTLKPRDGFNIDPRAIPASRKQIEVDGFGPKRRKLELPQLPPGVKPAQMAMDDGGATFPLNNWAGNLASGRDCGLYWPGYPYLSELAQRPEYRAPAETLAEEMTRKWIVFESNGEADKADRIRELEQEFERFQIRDLFYRATVKESLFGLAHVFIDLEGHDNHDEPLVYDSATIPKDSLCAFRLIEPIWCTPVTWNASDPTACDFYRPTKWMLLGTQTDSTRLITFISHEVPDLIKPSYNFGGISLSQLIEPYVNRWLHTVSNVNRLIGAFSIVNLKTRMDAILQSGRSASTDEVGQFDKRIELFNAFRDNFGCFLTDKELEELEILNVTLAGLSELQAQAQEHMAFPTKIPLVKYFGISPSGLNASSEGELDVFDDHILAMKETYYRPHLMTISKLLQLNRWGTVDEDITIKFPPQQELDSEAAARIRKTSADAGIAYIGAGVIAPEEERERLQQDSDSGYVNLSDEMPEPPALEEGGDPEQDEGNAGKMEAPRLARTSETS